MVSLRKLVLTNKPKDVIIKTLSGLHFRLVNGSYDYLLDLPMWSFTREKLEALKTELQQELAKLKTLESSTAHELWRSDLDEFVRRANIKEA